jgi:RNA polymerase sigma-70 factor (ECF subfamily)
VQDARVVTSASGSSPGLPLDRLREAYDRTHDRLWRSLRAWSGSREVADEAAAEAFAQAARRGDELRDVEAWVWRAAFRIAAGELRRRQQRPIPAGDALDMMVAYGPGPASAEGNPGSHHDLPDAAAHLVEALAQLSTQQRACVVLRDVAGLTATETARVLGTSPGTVRVQVFRSRRVLRALLEAHDG